MDYELNRLNPNEFEHLIQSLLKKIIGQGTTTFGHGPDGGREATYEGSASYPSVTNRWKGKWIFQVKFHNTYENLDYARKQIIRELDSELRKIVQNFPKRCDCYIMATNVSLSSAKASGTIDKIDEVRLKFKDKISNIHVWGYQEIRSYLDQYSDIRNTYSHLITPGDAIKALIEGKENERKMKHQNEDIKKILECWLRITLFPLRYIYSASYPPSFETFYADVLGDIKTCDPNNEALNHLKTGYYEPIFIKYKNLQNKVNKHNKKVAVYTIDTTKKTKILISQTVSSLKQCDEDQILVLNSYYLPNIIIHLRNIARRGNADAKIEPECINGVDGFKLYSGPNSLAFGSKQRIIRLNTLLKEYSIDFTKKYNKILRNLDMIRSLLNNFQEDIHTLIVKAKYGNLKGECEFEKMSLILTDEI